MADGNDTEELIRGSGRGTNGRYGSRRSSIRLDEFSLTT